MAQAQMFDVTKKTFVVVTGASKGIGAAIATELTKVLKQSMFILIARSESGLAEVKTAITPSGNKVSTFSVDLGKPDLDSFKRIFSNIPNEFEQKIIFHNAGQVGPLDKTTEFHDLNQWQRYYDLNVFSATILNTVFLKTLPEISTFVVNTSSLCGSVPFSNMSMYGSAKAARNLFFKVLAVEEPKISVLNYSPGPVDTDMLAEVINNMKDATVKAEFVQLRDKKTMLKPVVTTEKLLGILTGGDYKSGALIDYYDRKIDD